MILCSYGCGREATHTFKNGKSCCTKNQGACPVNAKKRTETRRDKGEWHSSATKKKIADGNKGKVITSESRKKISKALKGKELGPQSDEHRRKISEARKGQTPWNKGLSKDDPRVQKYAEAQTGVPKNHSEEGLLRIRENGSKSFSGENNPWYGKDRSKELSPRYLGETYNSDFRRYRNQVSMMTEKVYREFKDEINPNNFLRARAGIEGAYHLDHIVSVKEGFEKGIPAEVIADKSNLQMLPWLENLLKYDGSR